MRQFRACDVPLLSVGMRSWLHWRDLRPGSGRARRLRRRHWRGGCWQDQVGYRGGHEGAWARAGRAGRRHAHLIDSARPDAGPASRSRLSRSRRRSPARPRARACSLRSSSPRTAGHSFAMSTYGTPAARQASITGLASLVNGPMTDSSTPTPAIAAASDRASPASTVRTSDFPAYGGKRPGEVLQRTTAAPSEPDRHAARGQLGRDQLAAVARSPEQQHIAGHLAVVDRMNRGCGRHNTPLIRVSRTASAALICKVAQGCYIYIPVHHACNGRPSRDSATKTPIWAG